MMASDIKELEELFSGVLGFVGDIKGAASDGLDWGDATVIGESAMKHLGPAIQGMQLIPGEVSSNPIESASAVFGFAKDMYVLLAGGE